MSALGVLDPNCYPLDTAKRKAMELARAQVAELVAAAGEVWESEEGVGETDRPQYARLRAALAPFQQEGGK